jgi:hypothetical protein
MQTMHTRYSFPEQRSQGTPPSGFFRGLCGLAAPVLLYVAFTGNPGAGPIAFFGGLLLGVIAALCNAGVCAFTSQGTARLLGRPMLFSQAWLFVMLLGDAGVFWGFRKLTPSNVTAWWWIAGGLVVLLLGLTLTVLTSTANQNSRRSIATMY